MTDAKSDLVERAEAALSGLPLSEPDWDAFASRIESAVGAAPAEDTTLFDAPLPVTDDDGEMPVTAPADDSVPAPHEIAAPAAVVAEDAGPTLSVAPASSDEVDDGWSSAPQTNEPAPPPGSWVEASAEAKLGVAAAAEAEDLTAHASADDSAPVASAEPAASPREPVSLADLARASIARRGSAEKASIAKESLAVASQSRAQGDQVAQRVQAAASYPPPASPSVAPPPPSARRANEARSGDVLKGPWPGVVIAAVGLAAGFALYLRRPESPTVITTVQPAPEAPLAPRTETAREPVADRKREAVATPEPASEAALDPSSLPALRRGATNAEAKAGPTDAKGAGVIAKAPVAPAPPSTESTGKVAAEKIVLEEDQKAAPKTLPTPTARPADSKLRPAELSAGTMTERPSAGAAQAAVGAVLGAARACVAGHPQPSSAQLVFGSDGQVASVTVGGPAAGTPAAACIESALKKARVQPFAASSFSLGVTVRPQ